MTTVAMVAGMMPTALSIGGDGSWNQPMAVTVIGGLILSTFLTLLLVPAYFGIAIDMETWIGRKLGRQLGFPTLNVRLWRPGLHSLARPALSGVFAVRVHGLGPDPLPGVASLGTRPAVESHGAWLLETHLFDFSR